LLHHITGTRIMFLFSILYEFLKIGFENPQIKKLRLSIV